MKVIAPVREWGMGREEELKYAENHGIPVKQRKETPYSYDENMWANTGEGGEIEDPKLVPPLKNILQWCRTPEEAPSEPETIQIEFVKGVPVALNGEKKKLKDIIFECNKIGGKHGCGVFHLIEDRMVGLKVRGIYENPAATYSFLSLLFVEQLTEELSHTILSTRILIEAHKKLEMLVSTREENELKHFIDNKWAYLTYAAKWYDPVMYHIHAFTNSQNKKVTGKVTVRLYKGRQFPPSLI